MEHSWTQDEILWSTFDSTTNAIDCCLRNGILRFFVWTYNQAVSKAFPARRDLGDPTALMELCLPFANQRLPHPGYSFLSLPSKKGSAATVLLNCIFYVDAYFIMDRTDAQFCSLFGCFPIFQA